MTALVHTLGMRCLLAFLIVAPVMLTGQTTQSDGYSYINYTTFDGLSTNETYHVFQDDEKRLLISSDHGLMRYDGVVFEQLPFSDSRWTGSTVFLIKPDPMGRIWITSYRHGLFYLDGDTLKPHPYNHRIKALTAPNYIEDFEVDEYGTVWWVPIPRRPSHSDQFEFYRMDTSGVVDTILVPVWRGTQELSHYIYRLSEDQVIAGRNNRYHILSKVAKPTDITHLYPEERGWAVGMEGQPVKRFSQRCGPVLFTDVGCWFVDGEALHYHPMNEDTTLSHTFDQQVLGIRSDGLGNLLVGTNDGAYLMSDRMEVKQRFLPGNAVSDVYMDHEGGYWFATTGHGLFYLSSLSVFVLRHPDMAGKFIRSIATNKDHLAVATWQQVVHIFHVGEDSVQWKFDFPIDYNDPKEIFLSQQACYHRRGRVSIHDPGLSTPAQNELAYNMDIEVVDDSLLFITGQSGVSMWKRQGDTLRMVHKSNVNKEFLFTAIHPVGEVAYIGTDRGLFALPFDTWQLYCPFPSLPEIRISDIASIAGRWLVVSTKANGLYILDLETGMVQEHIDESNGLSSRFCSHIACEGDSVIWVGSNHGLNRIRFRTEESEVFTFYSSDGLLSDKINDLDLCDHWLFLSSDVGISYFRPEGMGYRESVVRPALKRVLSNDSLFDVSEAMVLQPGNRYLRLEFGALSFRRSKALRYAYRLLEVDSNWTTAKENYAAFGRLPPGQYTFELRAWSGSGMRHFGTASYAIEIPPFFYEQSWFQVVSALLVFGVLVGIMFFYFRQREHKRKQDWEVSISRLKALSLQMQPHFLYNSLQTVQYLSQKASDHRLESFVADLSSLTRGVLENSRQLLVSLEAELCNIEHYLRLEQSRAEYHPFEYRIVCSSHLDVSRCFMPPMLLQPMVENALWHGLYPKEHGARLVEIHCVAEHAGFRINVRDNGVGRRPPEHTGKPPGRASIGIENTRERIDLYRQMGFGHASFSIIDHKPEGTETEFRFYPKTHQTSLI